MAMDTSTIEALLHQALRGQDAVTAALQQALHWLTETGNVPPRRIVLDFPWIGQNTPAATDDLSGNDCGPAALAMWLNGLGETLTVDEVSRAAGKAAGYTSTAYWDLANAARKYGVSLSRKASLTPALLRAEIDKGTPLIVLVHYGSLPQRATAFTGGHWVLVVGYDDTHLIYHDPLFVDSRGAALACPEADFARAMADCSLDGNTPNQGLVRLMGGAL